LIDPKDGTGELNQVDSFSRHVLRKATSRGQRGQSRPGLPSVSAIARESARRTTPSRG